MTDALLGGRAIDWILVLVALEAVAVIAFRAARGRGPAPLSFLGNLLSGAFLLVALRNALAGGSSLVVWACLTGALVAHAADLVGRWERKAAPERRPSLRATVSLRVAKAPAVAGTRAGANEPSDG